MLQNNSSSSKQSDDMFNFLGKIFVILILAVVLIGGGYYFGRKSLFMSQTQIAKPTEEKQNEVIVKPTVTSQPTKETAQKPVAFKIEETEYKTEIPYNWNVSQDKDGYTTETTIQNNKSSLIIRTNMATEGVPCGFKDAPVEPSEMFPDVSGFNYKAYQEFSGSQNQQYRRVNITANPSAGKSFFALCQKRNNSWSQPIEFGFIIYEVPYSNDPEKTSSKDLEIMDLIITNLKVLE